MSPGAGTRRLTTLLWLCAAWVLLMLLSCVPVLAHANLVGSSPFAGSKLTASPEQVRLRFNEPVDAEFSPLEVRDSDGERVDEDDARVDPEDARVVLVELREVPEGSYKVDWRVTSLDGHVVEGRYGFAVIASGEDKTPGDGSGAEEQGSAGRAGQSGREGAVQEDGARGGSVPIVAYSALSLGALAIVAATAFLVNRLVRQTRA